MDSNVRKPLVAVSAMVYEGNTIVFSNKWGCYVENDGTGERLGIERVGDTFEMVLEAKKQVEGRKKVVTWARPEAEKYGSTEVDNVDDGEKGGNWVKTGEGIYTKAAVFRGQM